MRFVGRRVGDGRRPQTRFWFWVFAVLGWAGGAARVGAQGFEIAAPVADDDIPGTEFSLALFDGPSGAFASFNDGGVFVPGAAGRMISTGVAEDVAAPCAYRSGVPVLGGSHDAAQLRIEFVPLGDSFEVFLAAATHEFPDRFPGGHLYMNTADEFFVSLAFDGQTHVFSPDWEWVDNTGPFNSAFGYFNFSAYSRPVLWRVKVAAGKRCVLTARVRDGGDAWVDSALLLWGMRVFPALSVKYSGRLELWPAVVCSGTDFELRPRPHKENFVYDWRAPALEWVGDLTAGGKRYVAPVPGAYAVEADVYENIGGALRFLATLRREIVVFPGPVGDISAPSGGCIGREWRFGLQHDYAAGAEWDFGDGAAPRFFFGFEPPPVVFAKPGHRNVAVRLFNSRCESVIYRSLSLFPPPPPPPDNLGACRGESVEAFLPSFYRYIWRKENGRIVGTGNVFRTGPMLADSIYSLQTRNGECVRHDTVRVAVLAPRPAFFEYAFVGPQTLRFTYPHVPAPMRWLWDFGDGTSADERRPLKTFSPGRHRVTLITLDSLGCRDTFFTDIVVPESDVIAVPDAFTPNTDDVNREFRVFAQTLSDFQITIWDRYGRAVFVSRDPNFAWRGEDGHRSLPEGVYAYTIKAAAGDGKPFFRSGTITLFR